MFVAKNDLTRDNLIKAMVSAKWHQGENFMYPDTWVYTDMQTGNELLAILKWDIDEEDDATDDSMLSYIEVYEFAKGGSVFEHTDYQLFEVNEIDAIFVEPGFIDIIRKVGKRTEDYFWDLYELI